MRTRTRARWALLVVLAVGPGGVVPSYAGPETETLHQVLDMALSTDPGVDVSPTGMSSKDTEVLTFVYVRRDWYGQLSYSIPGNYPDGWTCGRLTTEPLVLLLECAPLRKAPAGSWVCPSLGVTVDILDDLGSTPQSVIGVAACGGGAVECTATTAAGAGGSCHAARLGPLAMNIRCGARFAAAMASSWVIRCAMGTMYPSTDEVAMARDRNWLELLPLG